MTESARGARRWACVAAMACVFIVTGPFLSADDAASAAAPPSGSGAAAGAGAAPAPSNAALPQGFVSGTRENFWRRFEIIAFGSYPITLLYVNFSFQVTDFVASGFDTNYAPWPFSGQYTNNVSVSEELLRMGIAAGVSIAVAGLDALFRRAQDRKAALEAAAHTVTAPPGAEEEQPAPNGGQAPAPP